MAFQKLSARLTGVAPLLMHSGQMIDPRNASARALKAVSSKRMKTDADFEEMARIEWTASLYLEGGKIVLPSEVVEAAIVSAARKTKNGKQAQAGVFVEAAAPLIFNGAEKTPAQLWADGVHVFAAPVRVGAARVIRTRPRFNEWAADITVVFDDMLMNRAAVEETLTTCGEIVGLCDWRPKFGRFTVSFS
jgi:hypothetical protein